MAVFGEIRDDDVVVLLFAPSNVPTAGAVAFNDQGIETKHNKRPGEPYVDHATIYFRRMTAAYMGFRQRRLWRRSTQPFATGIIKSA